MLVLGLILACPAPSDSADKDSVPVGLDSGDPSDTADTGDTGGDTADSGDTGCDLAWFRDGDRDGLGGDPLGTACEPPEEGAVGVAGDCDDADSTVFPGAPELCDDQDNDCDGAIDEDAIDAEAWFEDADGDGWGSSTVVVVCDAVGVSGKDGDCNDAEPAVNPDMAEVCEDGVDQDCSGLDLGCFGGGSYDVATDLSSWQGTSEAFGSALSNAGDLDGDGVADVMIVSADSYGSGGGGGVAYYLRPLYGGSFSGGHYAATTLPAQYYDETLSQLAVADFDGDGQDDLLATGSTASGTALLQLWGGRRWTTSGTLRFDNEMSGTGADFVGSALALGDHDGDGVTDVFVASSGGGKVVYGGSRADTTLGSWSGVDGGGGYFGGGDLALGDLDGDGMDDLLYANVYEDMTSTDYPGAVYVAYSAGALSADLNLPGDEDAIIRGDTGKAVVYMGYRLDSGDLDADGYDDIVAAGHMYDSTSATPGRVWVFPGSSTRLAGDFDTSLARGLVDAAGVSYLGTQAVVTPDLDGDGGAELFLAVTNTSTLVFLGADVTGTLTEADYAVQVTGSVSGSAFGLGLASGDLDDDGLVDLMMTGSAYNSGDGAVWHLTGSAL